MIKIVELFNNPANFKREYEGCWSFIVEGIPYLFFAKSIRSYTSEKYEENIFFSYVEYLKNKKYNTDNIISIDYFKKDIYEITFMEEIPAQNQRYKDYSCEITGKGNAPIVFSTVIDILKDFISEKNPITFYFFAKEKSRIKLYDIFYKISKRFFPDYSVLSSTMFNGERFYFFTSGENLIEFLLSKKKIS